MIPTAVCNVRLYEKFISFILNIVLEKKVCNDRWLSGM